MNPTRLQGARKGGAAFLPNAREPVRLHAYDHWHINLEEDWELRFWSREFDREEDAIREAVAAVGNVAGDVRRYLTHDA